MLEEYQNIGNLSAFLTRFLVIYLRSSLDLEEQIILQGLKLYSIDYCWKKSLFTPEGLGETSCEVEPDTGVPPLVVQQPEVISFDDVQ